MTKETKIGLLVGLAFIILFAIILSEKGATRGTKSPSALTAADTANKPKTDRTVSGPRPPLHDAGRLPVENRYQPAAPGTTAMVDGLKPRPKSGSTAADEPIAAPGGLPSAVVQGLNQGADDNEADDEEEEARPSPPGTELTSLDQAVRKALDDEPAASGGDSGTLSTQSPPQGAAATSGDQTASAGEDAAKPSGSDGTKPTDTAKADREANAAVAIKTVHQVQPGESLGKIAAKYYGRSTPERVEAIYNANRDVLKSKQVVKANDKLKIPALEGHESSFEPATGFAPAKIISGSVPSGPPPKPRGDGLTRIPKDVTEKLESGETSRRGDPRPTERKSVEPSPAETRAAGSMPRAPESALRQVSPDEIKTREPAPVAYQLYEVQKSDTLAKIAKRYLGDEKRYREIQRLNQDQVPDVNRLKPGIRIRIPARNPDESA